MRVVSDISFPLISYFASDIPLYLVRGLHDDFCMCVDCTMTFIYNLIAPKLGSLSGFEISLDGGIKSFERAV